MNIISMLHIVKISCNKLLKNSFSYEKMMEEVHLKMSRMKLISNNLKYQR